MTLSAEVARTWFALIESHAQLALLDEQIETNQTGLSLQESRFGLGQVRSADVLRQRQLVESTLEQAVVVKARIEVLEHQLAVLLGQPPQEASYSRPEQSCPSCHHCRPPGCRRNCSIADPMFAATIWHSWPLIAIWQSAITAQYPRISLSGSVLNIADRPETLFRDWFTAIGGQLIAPLIDGGQRRAEVDRTAAVVRQRFNEYGQTMLNAFREVEDSLAFERYQIERLELLDKQVELARQASEQLREQYLIGDTDYLNVLSAITTQQRLQRETLAARLELLLIRIGLYQALAGDFEPVAEYPLEFQAPLVAEELFLESENGPMQTDELPEAETTPEV